MAKAMAMTNTSSKQLQMWHIFLAALAALLILGNFGCGGGGGGNGDDPIVPVVCNPPFVPSSLGTVCVCPAGTHDQNQTCVPNGTTDTTPPTVTLVSPTNGSTVSGTVNVVANVVDASTIAEVALYLDNNSRSESFTESPAGTYTAQLTTTTLTSGSHTVKVCAIDSHANNGCSSIVSVSVNNAVPDTTPPTVTFVSPTNGSTVSGTFALTTNATDDRGIATVKLVVDGAETGNVFTESPAHVFTTNVLSPTLVNGTHTFQVCATDTATNRGCSSTATLTVYNIAPGNMIINSLFPYDRTVTGTFELSLYVYSDRGIATIKLIVDGAETGNTFTQSGSTGTYRTNVNSTTLSNNIHTFQVCATDTSLYTGCTRTVRIDVNNELKAPTVQIQEVACTVPTAGFRAAKVTWQDNSGSWNTLFNYHYIEFEPYIGYIRQIYVPGLNMTEYTTDCILPAGASIQAVVASSYPLSETAPFGGITPAGFSAYLILTR